MASPLRTRPKGRRNRQDRRASRRSSRRRQRPPYIVPKLDVRRRWSSQLSHGESNLVNNRSQGGNVEIHNAAAFSPTNFFKSSSETSFPRAWRVWSVFGYVDST